MSLSPYPTLRLRVTPDPSLRVRVSATLGISAAEEIAALSAAVLTALSLKVGGPGISNDNAVPRWDGVTGTLLQGSGVFIDDSNRILIGTPSAVSMDNTGGILINTLNDEDIARPGLFAWGTGSGPVWQFGRSFGTSIGAHGVLSEGSQLGSLRFYGSDGVGFFQAAGIHVNVYGDDWSTINHGTVIDFTTTTEGEVDEHTSLSIHGTDVHVTDTLLVHEAAFPLSIGGDLPHHVFVGRGEDDGGISLVGFDGAAMNVKFVSGTGLSWDAFGLLANGDEIGSLRFFQSGTATYHESAMLRVAVDGTPNTGDSPGRFEFWTTPDGGANWAERWRITSAGRLVGRVGGGGSIGFDQATGHLQLLGDNADTSTVGIARFSNDSSPARIEIGKSRGTVGVHAVLSDGDDLFEIRGESSDGGDFDTSVIIRAESAGGSAADSTPGRLSVLTTPAGTNTAQHRQRWKEDGSIVFATRAGVGENDGAVAGLAGSHVTINDAVGGDRSLTLSKWTADGNAPFLDFFKSRGGHGSYTVVATGDELMRISAYGADGTDAALGGYMRFMVEGTPGGGDMPTRWDVATSPDASESPAVRMSVLPSGTIKMLDTVGGSPGGSPLLWLVRSSNPFILLEDDGTGTGGVWQGGSTHLYGENDVIIRTGVAYGTGPISSGTNRVTVASGGTTYFHDNLIAVRAPSDANHGLAWGNLGAGSDGVIFRGFGGFEWRTGTGAANLQMHITGSGYLRNDGGVGHRTPQGKSGNFSVVESDFSFLVDNGATTTATLQAASSYPGRILMFTTRQAQAVVSSASNVVPRVGGAAVTNILPATDGAWAMIQSDGTNWNIIASS